MGEAGGLGWENILTHEEFCRSKFMFGFMNVRLSVCKVFSKNIKGANLFRDQPLHHLGHHQAILIRQILNPPCLGKLCPYRFIDYFLVSREHIG